MDYRIYNSSIPAGNWTGAECHITPGQQWVSFGGWVIGSGPGYVDVQLSKTLNSPLPNYSPPTYSYAPVPGNTFYLSQSLLALTQPGQFLALPSALYLYQASDPGADDVEANSQFGANYVDELDGANSVLKNIDLLGAFLQVGGNNVTVDGLHANYLANFNNLNDDNGFPPSGFGQQAGSGGIQLLGSGDVLENSTISNCAGNGVYLGNTGDQVLNNTIDNVDWAGCDYAGVTTYYSGNTINGNTIYNCGRAAINFRIDDSPGLNAGTTIQNNTVYNFMMLTTDGGGIYTFANYLGGTISENTVYQDISSTGGYGTAGIMLDTLPNDNQTANFTVSGNQTANANFGLKINGNTLNCSVVNNNFDATTFAIVGGGTWANAQTYGNYIFDPSNPQPASFVQPPASTTAFLNPPQLYGQDSGSSVTLNWEAVSGAMAYIVYRDQLDPSDPNSGPPPIVVYSAGNALSWSDDATDPNPRAAGTMYRYYVVATNYSWNAYASAPYIDPPPAALLADPSFESPTLGASVGSGTANDYIYDPTGTPWGFTPLSGTNGSGVTGNGTDFTASNPNAPDGVQVAFLQGTGSIAQTISLAAGAFAVDFQAAQRIAWQTGNQDFQVLVDGNVVGTFTPESGGGYAQYTTSTFTVSAGDHAIEFLGLDSAGGDHTAFIDAVQIIGTSAPGAYAAFVRTDPNTQGNWTAIYGAEGYDVIDGGNSVPGYIAMSTSGAQPAYNWSWVTGPQTLSTSPGSPTRVAACIYSSTSFSVNISVNDLVAHQVALYLLDGDSQGRSETVQAFDASSGAALTASTTVSNFSGGRYLVFEVLGNVKFVISNSGGSLNCVLSGVFFG